MKAIDKLLCVLPSSEILDLFERTARPVRQLVEVLVDQNTRLRRTRDLLLPRLISGELDLSELDIDMGGLDDGGSGTM